MAYAVKPKAKRQRVVAFPLVEAALTMWMKQASAQYAPVTGDIFQCVLFPCLNNWFLPSLLLNLAELTTSPPPSHCSTKMLAEADRKRICELPEAILPADIFNMDKTGLCYACTLSPRLAVAPSCYLADVCLLPRMLSDTGLAQQWRSGVKQQKLCLTYAFTVNADGTKMLELFVIGKLAKPVPFGRKSPNDMGFSYHYNIKAWMTSALFDEYALFLSLPCPCGPSSTLMLTLCPPPPCNTGGSATGTSSSASKTTSTSSSLTAFPATPRSLRGSQTSLWHSSCPASRQCRSHLTRASSGCSRCATAASACLFLFLPCAAAALCSSHSRAGSNVCIDRN